MGFDTFRVQLLCHERLLVLSASHCSVISLFFRKLKEELAIARIARHVNYSCIMFDVLRSFFYYCVRTVLLFRLPTAERIQPPSWE